MGKSIKQKKYDQEDREVLTESKKRKGNKGGKAFSKKGRKNSYPDSYTFENLIDSKSTRGSTKSEEEFFDTMRKETRKKINIKRK